MQRGLAAATKYVLPQSAQRTQRKACFQGRDATGSDTTDTEMTIARKYMAPGWHPHLSPWSLCALWLACALPFAFLLGRAGASAAGGEMILSFDSDIRVHRDSSMTVRETIRVRSEGKEIRRGIYREFPTKYRDTYGNRYNVGFRVTEVLRDGKPEPHHIKPYSNGVRIYIGKKDVFLPPGEYTYTLTYRTDRQLGYFDDHDELYWNATGNGWAFPIERATATVTFPEGGPREGIRVDAYTGPEGARGKSFISEVDPSGAARFATVSPLRPKEGLTIVVGWPKGFVRQPDTRERAVSFVSGNRTPAVGLAGMVLVLCYYLFTWARVGKDPSRGTIIPLYGPPDGISPAAARYVWRMGYDERVFASAIIDMAVKGYLSIDEEKGVYTLIRRRGENPLLSPEEKKVSARLFSGAASITLKSENHARVSGAIDALKNSLKAQYEKTYFLTNRKYFVPGAILSIGFVLLSCLFAGRPEHIAASLFISIWLTGWTFGVVFLLSMALSLWRGVASGGAAAWGRAITMSLFALPFVGGEALGIWFLASMVSPLMAVILLSIAAVNCFFYHLLKAPTLLGRRVMDQIEGFRMFLSVAEKDRLDLLHPADMTPQLFERYLPYALALGVEQAWSEQFADVLSRAAADGAVYVPSWYSGAAWSSSRMSSFGSSLAGSLSSAISSSSHAPGSSSGFGGGGSSGGGGGGGGGGGW